MSIHMRSNDNLQDLDRPDALYQLITMEWPHEYMDPMSAFIIALLHYFARNRITTYNNLANAYQASTGAESLIKKILEVAPQTKLINQFMNNAEQPSILSFPYLYNLGKGLPNFYYKYVNFVFKVYLHALDITPFHCQKPTLFECSVKEISELYIWTMARKRRWVEHFMFRFKPLYIYHVCVARGQAILSPLFIMKHLFTFSDFSKLTETIVPSILYTPSAYYLVQSSQSVKKLSKSKSLHLIHITNHSDPTSRKFNNPIQRRIRIEKIRINDPF